MDLNNLLAALWKKKWVLIIVPLFAVAAALAVRMMSERKYKSTGQLATGLTVADELIGNKNLNPYEVQVTFNNLTETIKSRAVIGLVSYQLLLHDLTLNAAAFRRPPQEDLAKIGIINSQNQYPALREILGKHIDELTLLDPNKPAEKQILLLIDLYKYDYENLLKELQVFRINQSDFIEISSISENASLSAYIVNMLCMEFIRYYTSIKLSRSNSSVGSLELIVNQRKQYLDDKIAELQQFKSNTDIINSSVESEARIRQVKQLEDQIAQEQQKIRSLELTLANIDLRLSNATQTQNASNNYLIVELRDQLDVAYSKYIKSGQTDKALLDTVKIIRARLDNALKGSSGSSATLSSEDLAKLRERKEEAQVALEIAHGNLNSITKIYNSTRYTLGEFANKETLNTALEKEVEVAREEYLAAQNRLSEVREKLLTNQLSVSQLLIAEPADKVESRKTLLFMTFSGAISFILCAFVIIVMEVVDSRIKTPQRLKSMTRLKLAGSLPRMETAKTNDKSITFPNGLQFKAKDELRKIRFEIEASKPRVVLVTSTKEAQGKSFLIMALAYSFSMQKKRVLIIDTNFRNNTLTQIFLAQPSLQLLLETFTSNTKLLAQSTATPGNSKAPKAKDVDQETKAPASKLISHTQNRWIDIIGNKKSQTSPSELIPDNDFTTFLHWLQEEYDYILMEGPGLNTYSDTKELISFVDLVIPVFSADSSLTFDDTESLNFLKSLQQKLGPAVLNNYQNAK
jgi:Mrp family chromosome partitioning ATPase/uncharacterized protein involved in exopolysaccharide biosynthesis